MAVTFAVKFNEFVILFFAARIANFHWWWEIDVQGLEPMTRIEVNVESSSQEYIAHLIIEIVYRIMVSEPWYTIVIIILDL